MSPVLVVAHRIPTLVFYLAQKTTLLTATDESITEDGTL